MRDHEYRSAPNYTGACIVLFGVNLIWILTVIWAIWGLIAVALTGWLVSRSMDYLSQRAAIRAAQDRAHPRARARW